MALCSDNVVIRKLAGVNKCRIDMILYKYHIVSVNRRLSIDKHRI